jgi:hypothetical protein
MISQWGISENERKRSTNQIGYVKFLFKRVERGGGTCMPVCMRAFVYVCVLKAVWTRVLVLLLH